MFASHVEAIEKLLTKPSAKHYTRALIDRFSCVCWKTGLDFLDSKDIKNFS